MGSEGAFAWNQLLNHNFTLCRFILANYMLTLPVSWLKSSSMWILTNCHLLGGFPCLSWAGRSRSPWWLLLSNNLTFFYLLCPVVLLLFCLYSVFLMGEVRQTDSKTVYSNQKAATGCQFCEVLSSLAVARYCQMVLAGTAWKNHFSDCSKASDRDVI